MVSNPCLFPRNALVNWTIAVAAAFAVAGPPMAAAQSSRAADLAAIGKVAADFSQRYMRGDARGMASLYTADAAIFPGGRPIIKGRDAITAYWTLPPNVKMIAHKTTADTVVIVGSTAYDYGTFTSQSSRDGQAGNPGYGKYVIVWQQQADGRWLMQLDIWNGSPPPGT
jgi:ketosteroid isomerase-like protein